MENFVKHVAIDMIANETDELHTIILGAFGVMMYNVLFILIPLFYDNKTKPS